MHKCTASVLTKKISATKFAPLMQEKKRNKTEHAVHSYAAG